MCWPQQPQTRDYQQILHQKGTSSPRPEIINRHYIREEPAAPDQRVSTDTTAEQKDTSIKVIYCKTAYLIR
jgi:hypothetical protein